MHQINFERGKKLLLFLLLVSLHVRVFSQESPDTVITIKDTLIRISEDSILQQERGEEDAVILTKDSLNHTKWKKLVRVFERDSAKNFSVIGFPIIAYRPETNFNFGATVQFFFRQKQFKENHLSSVRAKGLYTLNKQYETFVEHELFFGKKNKIWIDGIAHYLRWLEDFYGIGNQTEYDTREQVDYTRWYADLRLLYKIRKVYFGPQARFGSISDLEYATDSTFDSALMTGKTGYRTTGIGAAVVFDTRDNNIFPFTGYYITLSNYNHPRWASDNQFSFYNLEFDYRQYFNPKKGKHVLALRGYIAANFGNPPFRLMALHGGQYLGRGYYEGRYSAHHIWVAQAEWRFPVVWNFRGVLFASAGDVAHEASDWSFTTIKWAVGAGLRYVINLKERTSIRLDYAHGKSKNDQGFYFGTGEVF